jgi:hypothetical protein
MTRPPMTTAARVVSSPPPSAARATVAFAPVSASLGKREKGVGLAQKMQVAPYTFLWECSYKRLKLAQFLGQLGVFLILGSSIHLSSF